MTELEAKTCDIAGSLLSLGKIFVPTELLARGEADLKPDERVLVASSHIVSAELLRDVTFDGPVVETIRQSAENWDGSGPLGLNGDKILLTARVVAVANMFVRRISARSYREGMSFEDAMNDLLADTGKRFDRRAVSALINFLENRDGLTRWARFRDRPPATRH